MSDYLTIDIRDWKQTTMTTLREEITQAVKATQQLVVRPLPDKLVITPAQYDILQHDPAMQGMYESNQHVYVTTENAMDVIIQER